jgi:hypothetical protein
MPKRMTETQRQTVLHMLAQGMDRDTIATNVGLTPGQVSAVAAHVKMGAYQLPTEEVVSQQNIPQDREQTKTLLHKLYNLEKVRLPKLKFPLSSWGSMQKRTKRSLGILIRRVGRVQRGKEQFRLRRPRQIFLRA